MKIALFDSYAGKFSKDMEEYWVQHRHEVKRDTNYNPELVVWADVVWFELADNNLISASNPEQALKDEWKYANRPGAWDMHEMDLSKKKVICRPIDIDVWTGHHASIKWDVIDECIFVAPHIKDIMMADSRPQDSDMNVHVIPCGVNLEKWTFKERERGFNIGVVAERWISKGVDYVLQIAIRLKAIDSRYHIYWLGKNNDYHWEAEYCKDFIRHLDLPITLQEEYVDNLNGWWEDKHYVLHASHKETYTYAVSEAMAKGIKPVFHRYFGADATWPNLTWTSIDEAVNLITEEAYDSNSYRQYLIDHQLTLPQMMAEFDKIIKE